jgi:acyl-[acyl carrier protein]--UDP-N-acetylglucosamine O-acyltransferase
MTNILNIITSGQDIGNVLSVASELGYDTKIIECNLNDIEKFSLKFINQNLCFIALEFKFLGLPYKYLFREAKLRKINLVNLISKEAQLSPSVILGSNIYIGRSVNIKAGCILHDCIFIDDATTLGVEVTINSYTHIGKDASIRSNCLIEGNCLIGNNATINTSRISKFCSLEKPIVYNNDFQEFSHFIMNHRSIITKL